jgi:FKBP-type peptidyl-prolyl cis-trans isomerase FklB
LDKYIAKIKAILKHKEWLSQLKHMRHKTTMKYTTIAIITLGLWYGVCSADEVKPARNENAKPVEIKSDNDKVLYSLGYELGKDIDRQKLELTPEVLLKGVEDAISGGKPLINAHQRQVALKQIKEMRAQNNLEQSQAFLGANAKKEGVQTLPSGLQYKVITPGEGKTPTGKDTVVVHYRGTLIDGSEFDSSYERGKPATFALRKVIKGWQEGLRLMKEGAKWELYIPPDLAYGKHGRPQAIPPNSALIFEVELLKVK